MRVLVVQSEDGLRFNGDVEAIVAVQNIEYRSIDALKVLAECLVLHAQMNIASFPEDERNRAVLRLDGMRQMAHDLLELAKGLKNVSIGETHG